MLRRGSTISGSSFGGHGEPEPRYGHDRVLRTGIDDLEGSTADLETDLGAPRKELLHVGLGEVDSESIVVGPLLDFVNLEDLLIGSVKGLLKTTSSTVAAAALWTPSSFGATRLRSQRACRSNGPPGPTTSASRS